MDLCLISDFYMDLDSELVAFTILRWTLDTVSLSILVDSVVICIP